MDPTTLLIDLAVVAGAALVLPAATRRFAVAWRVVAASTALALALAPSAAAGALALPWVAVGAACAGLAAVPLLRSPVRSWTLHAVAPVVLAGWSVMAGLFLVDSCLGRHPGHRQRARSGRGRQGQRQRRSRGGHPPGDGEPAGGGGQHEGRSPHHGEVDEQRGRVHGSIR